jgi:hypothetical protein
MTPPICSAPPRAATAILIASQASWASGCSPVAPPSNRREYRSITVARYSLPAAVGISVMSPTHRQFGLWAVKSRLSRSGNFGAVLSCRVSPLRLRIRRATRPWRRIESATVFSDTVQPASRRSACSRGEPCKLRALVKASATAASSSVRRCSVGVGVRSIHLYNQDSDTPSSAQVTVCGTR